MMQINMLSPKPRQSRVWADEWRCFVNVLVWYAQRGLRVL